MFHYYLNVILISEILVSSNIDKLVQVLNKVFKNIKKLQFDPQNLLIQGKTGLPRPVKGAPSERRGGPSLGRTKKRQ